jgi:hypothetical protein
MPAPLIRGVTGSLATSKEPGYGINGERRALPVKVSGARTDRLPASARKALETRGISATRAAGDSPQSRVPAKTRFDRKTVKPGEESV